MGVKTETETPTTPDEETQTAGQVPVEEPPTGEPQKPEEETPPEEPKEEAEPKTFSEDYVKALREEAASYRTQLRETQERLREAKTPEEVAAAIAAVEDQNRELRRDLIAERHHLPPELRKVLQGNTDEELEAHAKELSQFVRPASPPPTRSGGGLDGADAGGDDSLPEDPGELVERLLPRRHF